jgi:uncharacterized protein YdcH (DUF465 family)
MLGEDHSLVNEFPTYKNKIAELNAMDESFASDAKRYHQLDSEIRKLELNNAPIDDQALHQLKHDRAVLKDVLYQCLIA